MTRASRRVSLRLVLGDQLSLGLSALSDLGPSDVVLLVEVHEEATYVRHHQQKIALIFSAMRHFAAELQARGRRVDYVRLDAPGNTGSFTGELERAVARHRPSRVVVTEPGEWRVRRMMDAWTGTLGQPVEIREDDRFLCSHEEFEQWAEGRSSFRMEFFYRMLRRRTGWLMDGDRPVGGEWNYDAANRERLPADEPVPTRLRFEPDAITREVLELVGRRYADHFGTLEGFGWASQVSRRVVRAS